MEALVEKEAMLEVAKKEEEVLDDWMDADSDEELEKAEKPAPEVADEESAEEDEENEESEEESDSEEESSSDEEEAVEVTDGRSLAEIKRERAIVRIRCCLYFACN